MSDNDDPLKRAKRALEVGQSRRTDLSAPLPDQSKIEELLARAREAASDRPRPAPAPPEPPRIEERPRPQQAAPPPTKVAAPAGPPQVRLQMVCSARGDSFIGIAERQGSEVRLVGHELLSAGSGHGGAGSAELLSGQYTLAGTNWNCPICRTRPTSLWTCPCSTQYAGVLHCGGFAGRAQHCACGKLEQRALNEVPSLELRGSSVVTASSKAEPALKALHMPLPRGGVPAVFRKR
jgi:hypothetical protein